MTCHKRTGDARRVNTAALPTEHVLLVDCDDRPGLVHAITGVLFKAGANIVSNHEYVDADTRRFFMRTACRGLDQPALAEDEIRALLPPAAAVRIRPATPRRLVVLATKEHHCVADLLVRHAYRELGAEIVAVISNHGTLGDLAGKFSVPFHHVPHEGLSREEHEGRLAALIAPMQPDYLVLAKYMRVLSPSFVAQWPSRIVNIHHSFLPAFIGSRPYLQAFRRGVKVIGATSHFVTENLDEGPIIEQRVIPVSHAHTPSDLAEEGRDVECLVLSNTIKLLNEDRVMLCAGRTVIFD